MKKMLAVVLVGMLGFALNAYGQETQKVKSVKETTKVEGAKTTETTTVKTDQGGKATETVTTDVTKPGEETTKTKLSGKHGKATRTTETKGATTTGTSEFNVKKGSIDDLKITWKFTETAGGGAVLDYNVLENDNPNLVKELGLTSDQAKMIKKGQHTVAASNKADVEKMVQNFRSYILADLAKVKQKSAK